MRWDRESWYRISNTAKLAICAIAIAVAIGRSSTARPYYSLLPAGSKLPSDRACAAGTSGDAFELVLQNSPENDVMPSASDLKEYKSEAATGEGGAPGSYLARVDGQFTGSTDAISQVGFMQVGLR
jgi:hypothetical protein